MLYLLVFDSSDNIENVANEFTVPLNYFDFEVKVASKMERIGRAQKVEIVEITRSIIGVCAWAVIVEKFTDVSDITLNPFYLHVAVVFCFCRVIRY